MHKSIKWSFGSLFLLVIPVTAFSLGCWQYKRLKWKLGLKESLKEKLKFDVIPFPSSDLSSLKNLEYRKVRLVGEFLHDREFAIKPRGRFDEGYIDHPGGLIANSQSASHGAHIITPFKLADSGIIVLVNRGWVPRDKLNASTRKSGQISGEVTLDAIVRLPEKKGWFDNEPAKNAWYYRDIETMANYHGTAPVFLDAVYGSTVSGGPIGGQTNINIRDDHLSYLITWYLLSALTTIMWLIKFRS